LRIPGVVAEHELDAWRARRHAQTAGSANRVDLWRSYEASATSFEETLHPIEVAQRSMLQIVSSGYLPDGRTFQFEAVEATDELRQVRIVFR
jgi:hypothetical protein